jgi:hypothetical protein
MKYLKKFENYLDDILDKISASGMKSLTNDEREYLTDYPNGTAKEKKEDVSKLPVDFSKLDQQVLTSLSHYYGEIGPCKSSFTLTSRSSTKMHGILEIENKEYDGYILVKNNVVQTAIFDIEGSDLYTDYEGLEEEIYSFMSDVYDHFNGLSNLLYP